MTSKCTNAGFINGRRLIIGRTAQIRIDDPSVSRSHAEIKFSDGMILIRDLCSTNGTFVEKDGKFVLCQEAHLSPNSKVKIGSHVTTVKGLLAISGIYAVTHEDTDFTIILSKPNKHTTTDFFEAFDDAS
ncbi:MAG: FHA domain-containing protein [Pseudomonadota bacterium]